LAFPSAADFQFKKPIKTNTDKEKQVFICKTPCFCWFFFVFIGFLYDAERSTNNIF